MYKLTVDIHSENERTYQELQTFLEQGKSMEWIADIRARQTAGRDCLIRKLSLLGWTQREIAEKVGMSKGGIEYSY
jgi:hypothetical protein